MNELIHIDRKELFLEIARYLAAVDLYRAENCEPTWRPESRPCVAVKERLHARPKHAPSAH
jgi:hypothetical protein